MYRIIALKMRLLTRLILLTAILLAVSAFTLPGGMFYCTAVVYYTLLRGGDLNEHFFRNHSQRKPDYASIGI